MTRTVIKKGAWTKAALERQAGEKAEYWDRVRDLRDWASEQGLGAWAALTQADPVLKEGIGRNTLDRALKGRLKNLDGRSEKEILTKVEEAKVVQWLKSSALNCGAVKEQQLRDGQKELSAEVKKLLRLRQRANKAVNNSARFGAIPLTKASMPRRGCTAPADAHSSHAIAGDVSKENRLPRALGTLKGEWATEAQLLVRGPVTNCITYAKSVLLCSVPKMKLSQAASWNRGCVYDVIIPLYGRFGRF